MGGYAWVTLATNDSYSLGALVLAHSLKKAKTAHKLVVLITPAVSQPMREQLQSVFDVVKVVDVLDSKDEAHLALMQRPELGITFTKIHCWRMTEFDKCVFLDADTLVVRNCDELFEREEFSAAPDVSWPDCFNSGVFVYRPSVETFNKLLQFAVEKGSFDGGDQGLLNQFFSDWATEDIKKHLPFVYNLTSVATYSYIPAFKHYGTQTRIVHFIGTGKPWLQQLDPATRTITPTAGSEHLRSLLQQWWDLFCEKVHPALDKSLESNKDGISHPPVEACSNSLPIALTDDSQTPRLIEPCTPYREKDDFRQYNLPYQPFDVRGSSGELLNVEFLLASVVQSTPQEKCSDEQQRQEQDRVEERNRNENENARLSEWNEKRNQDAKEAEGQLITANANEQLEAQKEACENERTEVDQFQREEEQKEERQKQEEPQQPGQSEEPEPQTHPFDFNSFFPDETCINNYLERNVINYQPYDSPHHHHHHYHQPSNDQGHHASERICHQEKETSTEVHANSHDPQPDESSPPLPRFLTIPEDDRRQSGNVETPFQSKERELQSHSPPKEAPTQETQQRDQEVQEAEEKRELTKSKSMPYLQFDVTEVPSIRSVWKSQPDVSVDGNRRYSMPRLKPILPRQNSLSKSLPLAMPKVTLYTEFLMSAEYKDPADLPKDKVGFVESLITRGEQLRRSKSAADIADRFGPLPYASPETEQPAIVRKAPLHHFDSELYDLSQCKRQMGNKPKTNTDRRKENSHSLSALNPLVPPNEKKPTFVKKRKSKELSPTDGGREKILKREPRKPKDRKRETRIIPRNVSETSNGNNVNEILKKLKEFSKNYQHFFGEVPQRSDRANYRNAALQTSLESPSQTQRETNTSEAFLKTSSPSAATASKATQTAAREELDFRNFRNYVQEKSKTSQKGLLGIQELVSKPHSETIEGLKVSTQTLKSCSELNKTKEGVLKNNQGTKVRAVNVDERKSSGEDKTIDNKQSYVLETLILTDDYSETEDPNETLESISLSPLEPETAESLSTETEPTAIVLKHSQDRSERVSTTPSLPTVNGREESNPSSLQSDTNATHSVEENIEILQKARETVSGNEVRKEETQDDFERKPSNGNSYVQPLCSVESTGEDKKEEVALNKLNIIKTEGVPVTMLIESEKARTEENDVRGAYRRNKGAEKNVFRLGQCATHTQEPVKPDEILCVPDFDTPRSSRVTPSASEAAAAEVLEELIAKATSPPPRRRPRKPRRRPRGLAKAPASPPTLPNGKSPPDASPDSSPDGPLPSPPSPPRTTPNGTLPPPGQQELPSRSGIAGAIAQLSLEASSAQSVDSASAAHQEYLRRQNWETGNMDYMGRDSFDNIWSKICQTLEGKDIEETTLTAAAESPKPLADLSTATQHEQKLAATPPPPRPGAPTPAPVSPPVGGTPSPSFPAAPSTVPPVTPPPTPSTPAPGAPPPSATPSAPPPSADLQKCPDYIDTLPGDPAAGPAEDDEIIFSKAHDKPLGLTNISGEQLAGVNNSAEAIKVKLSDILDPKESIRAEIPAKSSEQASVAITPETTTAEADKAPVAEGCGGMPQPRKTGCTTVAICQPPPSVPQMPEVEKTEACTTVAIPSPPIVIPGAPFGDKGNGEKAGEKFDPIPLPPPDSPSAKTSEAAPLAVQEDTAVVESSKADSSKEDGKQKKGVISKILEIVGVTPKEKNGSDISKSVFYDLEGAVPLPKRESPNCEHAAAEEKKTATVTQTILETPIPGPEKEPEPAAKGPGTHNTAEGVGAPVQQPEKDETVPSPQTTEHKDAGAVAPPPPPPPSESNGSSEQKPPETAKSGHAEEKAKPPVEKPARNASPKLALSQTPPVTTAVTLPTPPPQTEMPRRKDSALLKVDETIPETPPVPQPPKEDAEDAPKGKVQAEVDDIIDKAKSEVESLLQDPQGPELINTMKLMMGGERTAQQPATPATPEVEELRVTSEEDRARHKSEVPSSKLSDQILKAIPPPRRKAISESSASAIPSPPPSPSPSPSPSPFPPQPPSPAPAPSQPQPSSSQQKTPKGPKPSSIPVPPPRNRGKPQQTTPTPATPSKGKPKK